MTDNDTLKSVFNPYSVGFLGAFLSLRWCPGKRFIDRAINLALGTAIVRFGCPVLIDVFNVEKEPTQMLIAFFVGLYCVNAAAKVNEEIKRTNFTELLKSVLPFGK